MFFSTTKQQQKKGKKCEIASFGVFFLLHFVDKKKKEEKQRNVFFFSHFGNISKREIGSVQSQFARRRESK